MEAPERRRQLNAWLTPESLAAWQSFAERHGTNVTALVESFGHYLQGYAETPAQRLPKFLAEVITRSQQVAGSRSSRARRSNPRDT